MKFIPFVVISLLVSGEFFFFINSKERNNDSLGESFMDFISVLIKTYTKVLTDSISI